MGRISLFGIRHHGPGSARSLLRALHALEPDCVLVEGPPDADAVLPLLAAEGMAPPVAILVYPPKSPRHGAFYPFAEFSPEWQAIRFALECGIPVRFMDLPQHHQIAAKLEEEAQLEEELEKARDFEETASDPGDELRGEGGSEDPAGETPVEADPEANLDEPEDPAPDDPSGDPLAWLGRAAGYSGGEDWWENMVEQRLDGADLFAAVHEAMVALREEFPRPEGSGEAAREARREAFMRRTVRRAQREGFERIAVVCGAWHTPALAAKVKVKDDDAVLRGLPKTKVEATWVPWTHGRLALASGYGAGIESPGWYEHLWTASGSDRGSTEEERPAPSHLAVSWLTRVARLLRREDLDCSSAHVIEAVRLAESLAALRRRPLPSLLEMNEASLTVMCAGEEAPLRLIHEKLTIGDRLGSVPESAPAVPLQRDLEAQQRRLRMKPVTFDQTLDLDLRKESGLARSHLLHRLGLLGVPWGERLEVGGKKGTFHEIWKLRWQPEFAVRVIEGAIWGNTVEAAASGLVIHEAESADLPRLSSLVDRVLLADLSEAVEPLMRRLEERAASSSDAAQLIDAVPPLVDVLRYGDVRRTETSMIEPVVHGLVTRIFVGLAPACASLDDEAAERMAQKIASLDRALRLLRDGEHLEAWRRILAQVMALASVNGRLAGRCCRLLLDARSLGAEEAAREMSLALSAGNEPADAAAWLEGFLTGGGMILLHDEELWNVLDDWVSTISGEAFEGILPLIRRTFAGFSSAERQQMGRRVKSGRRSPRRAVEGTRDLDPERGARVLPYIREIFGLEEA